jgi:hypothetical protein
LSEDDARFEEGGEAPLTLVALDPEDLDVVSSLVQDAVFPVTEMTWQPRARRFALLLNRFRWEDPGRARHAPERVRSLLVVDNVARVASQGFDRHDSDLVLSLLAVTCGTGADGAEHVDLTLAGDGAIRLGVTALEVTLRDVTRPYRAPSGKVPDHGA